MATFKRHCNASRVIYMESLTSSGRADHPRKIKDFLIFCFQFPLSCIIYWRLGGHTTIKKYMPLSITDSISILASFKLQFMPIVKLNSISIIYHHHGSPILYFPPSTYPLWQTEHRVGSATPLVKLSDIVPPWLVPTRCLIYQILACTSGTYIGTRTFQLPWPPPNAKRQHQARLVPGR